MLDEKVIFPMHRNANNSFQRVSNTQSNGVMSWKEERLQAAESIHISDPNFIKCNWQVSGSTKFSHYFELIPAE